MGRGELLQYFWSCPPFLIFITTPDQILPHQALPIQQGQPADRARRCWPRVAMALA